MDFRGVELRHLRYFVAVADELHFTRAAHRLGIAQPPLSQQIKRLEQLLGVTLFERRPRLALTAAGARLAPIARETLGRVETGFEHVREVAAGLEGTLRVGFASSTLLNVLPRIVRVYRQRRPRVTLQLSALSSAAQVEALASGVIDVAVIRQPPMKGFRCVVVHEESFIVVMPRRHRLSGAGRVRLEQLNDEPYVHFPRAFAPYLYDQIESLCHTNGVVPNVVQEADEWLTIVGLVEAGLGLSLVPASFVNLKWGGVVYREIAGLPVSSVTTLCLPERTQLPAADALFEAASNLPFAKS